MGKSKKSWSQDELNLAADDGAFPNFLFLHTTLVQCSYKNNALP